MRQDYQNNLIGAGEDAVFKMLEQITGLKYRGNKHLSFCNGLFRQVPINFIIGSQDYWDLSQPQRNSSIDIFIKLNQRRVAIRVQGEGHGKGLKGIGKAAFDKAQKYVLEKYCQVVDINKYECSEIFKNRVNQTSNQELLWAFENAHVSIPVQGEKQFD